MDPKIAGKILDRIAELSQGNEQRTMDYLSKPQTGAERQRRYEEKLMGEGLRQVKTWLPEKDIATVKAAFPSPRGGIDWKAVIKAALKTTGQEQ